MDELGVSGRGKASDPNFMGSGQELRQARMNPFFWTGTIRHKCKSFHAVMKSLDVSFS
jgi:hypothetical protein